MFGAGLLGDRVGPIGVFVWCVEFIGVEQIEFFVWLVRGDVMALTVSLQDDVMLGGDGCRMTSCAVMFW